MKKPSSPPRPGRWQGRVRTSPASVRSTGRPSSSCASIGRRATGRPAASACVDHAGRLPPAAASSWRRPGCRRARAWPTAASSSCACSSAIRRTSAGVLCQAMSGWRRIVPVAVQGASSTRHSAGAGGRQTRASATSISRRQPEALRGWRAGARPSFRDSLDRDHPSAGRGQLRGLAPGRCAQVDHTAPADVSGSRRAGRAAAASCTHQAPSP